MENNLQHWGIKGQRWGVRRFQNADGTLTPAGKKRYDKEMEKLKSEAKVLRNKARTQAKMDKLEAQRKKVEDLRKQDEGKSKEDKPKVEKPKKHKEKMTDDELREVIARLELEKRYETLQSEKAAKAAESHRAGLGRRFIVGTLKTVGGKMLMPALEDTGKQLIKSMLVNKMNDSDLIKKMGDDYKLHTNNKKKS